MDTKKILRQQVKKYVDTADVKVLRMLHAMLEVDAENDLWEVMPTNVKKSVVVALKQSDNKETIPHSEVQKMYKKWIAK
jgi:hypothetical protein